MRGLLVDVNIQGQMENCRVVLETTEWAELWSELGPAFLQFADVGLETRADTGEPRLDTVVEVEPVIDGAELLRQ